MGTDGTSCIKDHWQKFFPVEQYHVAWRDFRDGLYHWQLWGRLGWQDVKRRYRRSTLGPLWATASLALFIAGMVFIWAPLFRTSVTGYLPFIAAGLVSWSLINALVLEGGNTYVSGGHIITQISLPFSILNYVAVWRNVVIFFHNMLLVLFIDFLLAVPLGLEHIFLLFAGLIIVVVNGVWLTVVLGIIGVRYRDVPPLVGNIMQILMFVTPVFWMLSQFPAEAHPYLQLNYFLHLIEILRAPMLGQVPTLSNYLVTVAGAGIGWLFGFVLLAHFRRRIVYWM
jgi:ABC-type polysaccharide/polyol phosphate export permease